MTKYDDSNTISTSSACRETTSSLGAGDFNLEEQARGMLVRLTDWRKQTT